MYIYQHHGYPKIVNFMGKLMIWCFGVRYVQTCSGQFLLHEYLTEDDRTVIDVIVFDCAGWEWLDYQSPELTMALRDHGDLVVRC